MRTNSLGRQIPYAGERPLYNGEFALVPDARKAAPRIRSAVPGQHKVVHGIEEAVKAAGVRSGMTLSFHHHLREGDLVLNQVVDACARLGITDLTIAATSIFGVHAPLCEHIRQGVVTGIEANYITGPVGDAISGALLARPAVLRTHGGRVRAIEAGDLHIDVAFMAAPSADAAGNMNGIHGPSACGSLGYAVADANYADCVVAVTDNLVPYPLCAVTIPQSLVDIVAVVDKIGDPQGIVAGSIRVTRHPMGLLLAQNVARVVEALDMLKPGLSLQTGAGGASLASASFLARRMKQENIQGSFGLGGISSFFVSMLEEGLFTTLFDTQDFDAKAIRSLGQNPLHQETDCGTYANPHNSGAIVNYLDVVVLGATEIDTAMNVNVTTASDGRIIGGSGGHSDAAAGAKLTIVVTTSTRARLPVVRPEVTTVSTPGESIDVVVTERGIAPNPRRPGLMHKLEAAGLPAKHIEQICREVLDACGRPESLRKTDKVVALNEYRDGSVIDVVRQVN